MNRQGGATRWLSRVLRSVAVVLVAVIGMFTAAPAPAALVTYAYDTVGYTYDGPVLLSSPDTGATDARGSPSQREAGSGVSPVSVARDVVAAKGGIGPVMKGQAGVNQVAADIEAAGGKVLGREITVEANGVQLRP